MIDTHKEILYLGEAEARDDTEWFLCSMYQIKRNTERFLCSMCQIRKEKDSLREAVDNRQ